tara:strand:- start:57 stop:407 length:351 start_codon:yes stop_codon:yes gene_type:complete
MDTLKTEHILMVLIVAFLLYHFIGRCGCSRAGNGFRVGGQKKCGNGFRVGGPSFRNKYRNEINYMDGVGEVDYVFGNGPSPLDVLKGDEVPSIGTVLFDSHGNGFRVGGQKLDLLH